MSEPLSCRCNRTDCSLPAISLYIARKTYTAGSSRCGITGSHFAFNSIFGERPLGDFGENELGFDIVDCTCDPTTNPYTFSDVQGVYDAFEKTKSQLQWEFDGVTNTTTYSYGAITYAQESQTIRWNNRNVNAHTTCNANSEQTGSPSTTCQGSNQEDFDSLFGFGNDTGPYPFPVTTRLLECFSITRSPTSSTLSGSYAIEEPWTSPTTGITYCGGSGYETVNRTATESIIGDDVDGDLLLGQVQDIVESHQFAPPTNIVSEIPSINNHHAYAELDVENICPTQEEFGISAFCPEQKATPNNDAVGTKLVVLSKTRFQLVYELPVTCYLKVWVAKYKTKHTNILVYDNGTLMGDQEKIDLIGALERESTIVDIPKANNSCIDRNLVFPSPRVQQPFAVAAEDESLKGVLTIEDPTTTPPDNCCSDNPEVQCSFKIRSNVAILGWSIIDGYEPTFYEITYDAAIDPDPISFFSNRNYHTIGIGNSMGIVVPFNNYAPTPEKQAIFDQHLQEYNASKISSAP